MNKCFLSLLCVGMVIFSLLINCAVAEETPSIDLDGITLTVTPPIIDFVPMPIFEPIIIDIDWEPPTYYFSSSSSSSSSCSMELISSAPPEIIELVVVPTPDNTSNLATPIPNSGTLLFVGLIGMFGVMRKSCKIVDFTTKI